MDAVMASEMGFLGNNVDSNVSLPYAYTELVRKAQEGDMTALYKIEQLMRHYQGENAEELIAYLNNAMVEPVAVESIALSKSTATVAVDATETLTVTFTPTGATNKAVVWSTSDDTKATVSQTGVVTGKAAGEATITATTVDGGKTATCTVTVTAE